MHHCGGKLPQNETPDAAGWPRERRRRRGETVYRFDDRGQLIKLVDPIEHAAHYAYDEYGHPVQITDARGGVKRLVWDRAGSLIRYIDCSGRSTRFTYHNCGRLLMRTDAMGYTTTRRATGGMVRIAEGSASSRPGQSIVTHGTARVGC